MHGNKKNGANREAKTEQNTVKPKQVKKMQSSPHFVLRKAAQPPFIYESKNTREKEENFWEAYSFEYHVLCVAHFLFSL